MSTSSSPLPDSVQSTKPLLQFVRTRRFLGIAAAVFAAVAVGAAAVSHDGAITTPGDDPANGNVTVQRVETVVLEPTDAVQQSRTYTGVVAARRTAEIGFERSERVTELFFDEGDSVAAGDAVARLDTRQLQAQRRETAARLAASGARLDELVAGPRKETIAAARASVADLKAQLELNRRTYRRTVKLRDQDAATDQDIDDSELSLKSTEARLNVAEKQLEELEAGTRREQIAAQRANVEQLEAAVADIDLELSDSVLTAPFSGRIAARYIDEGTVVSPGQAVFRVVESGILEARIGLPMDLARGLSSGDPIDLSAGGSTCRGVVARKLPEIDPATRTQTIIVSVDGNDTPQLVPGQVVQTALTQRVEQTGFLLPTVALLPGVRGLWSVFAVVPADDHHVIERRYVEVLHTSGVQVLVRGTVAAGDRIVINGVQRLVHGQIVQPAE